MFLMKIMQKILNLEDIAGTIFCSEMQAYLFITEKPPKKINEANDQNERSHTRIC